MPLEDLARRVRAFLDKDRAQADDDAQRRVYSSEVANLDDIYYDDINGFPGRCIGGGVVAAVAAQFAFVQIFNPANSGVDFELEGLILSSGTAQQIQLRFNTVALGAASTLNNGRRDHRATAVPVCNFRGGNEAAASGVLRGCFQVAAGVPVVLPLDGNYYCGGPQNGIHIECATVNTDLLVTAFWREFAPDRRRRA